MNEKPRFLICEDGTEYLERFERFLGSRFEFIPSQDSAGLLSHVKQFRSIAGVLLDLDFRRIEGSRLIDAEGRALVSSSTANYARLAANQGIAILAQLRRTGCDVPAMLFADILEERQREYLMEKFSPLELVGSHVGLDELERRFEILGQGGPGNQMRFDEQ